MRVFVAIDIPPDVQGQMLAAAERIRLPVRWLAGKDLHITLVPPWHTDDIEEVRRQLGQLKTHRPFSIAFNSVSFGPPGRHSLIWATGPTTRGIAELKSHVESSLGVMHDRKFRMHVTLARFRPEDYPKLGVQRLEIPVDWRMRVDSVVLMESHLSAAGAEYEVLERVRFQG